MTILGRTGDEIYTRRMDSGAPMLTFRVGVDRGGRDEGTDQFACVMYGERAQAITRWMKGGLLVLVEGSVRLGQYSGAAVLQVAVANVVALSPYSLHTTSRVDGDEPADRPLPYDPMVTGSRLERLP